MIYTSVKVTVKSDTASINNPILLYRGDKNVEVQFEILESLYRQYKLDGPNTIENLSASYGQLIIKKPDSTYVPSTITETKAGKIIFTIPEEMIDEESEVGEFSFQIILYDESKGSKVSLPPVKNGIIVKEPLMTDNNTNAVGTAEVGDANVAVAYGVEDCFDADGDYNKTNWVSGDLITSSSLNKIEEAIFTINDNVKNMEFPTQEGVATEVYVDSAISALRTELIALINAGGGSIPDEPEIDPDEPETDNAVLNLDFTNKTVQNYIDEGLLTTGSSSISGLTYDASGLVLNDTDLQYGLKLVNPIDITGKSYTVETTFKALPYEGSGSSAADATTYECQMILSGRDTEDLPHTKSNTCIYPHITTNTGGELQASFEEQGSTRWSKGSSVLYDGQEHTYKLEFDADTHTVSLYRDNVSLKTATDENYISKGYFSYVLGTHDHYNYRTLYAANKGWTIKNLKITM